MDARSLPRVFAGASTSPLTLEEHQRLFGPVLTPEAIGRELAASGLLGRGGAGFPTARKVDLIAHQRGHKFVVVNAMEGEPAAHKDHRLMSVNPHLVLDGAVMLAQLVHASRIAVCVARDNPQMVNHVERAIKERALQNDRGPAIDLHTPPWRYVAGEESALVHWLDDNESLPQFRPTKPTVLRIGRSPVLVDNAETCAHVGLIGRFGAEWFRALGTKDHPGSTVVSITGAVPRPTVLEVNPGTTVARILRTAGADPSPQAVLLGGYGGAWLRGSDLDVPYCNEDLARLGLSTGAGILAVLPQEACAVAEAQRVVRWMAHESARQCGPCAFGLPALANDLGHVVRGGQPGVEAIARLSERCAVIEGRGACRHPDGVVRFVRSTLEVFTRHVDEHLMGQPCAAAAATATRYLSVPALEREEELVWE